MKKTVFNMCQRLLVTLIVSVFFVSGTACQKKEKTAECLDFYDKLNSNQREKEFKKFTFEKQLRIHRCGLDEVPMKTFHAYQLADRGRSIIPSLIAELDATDDDVTKYSIILVFSSLAVDKNLDKEKDAKTIQHLKLVPSTMQQSWVRDYTVTELERIDKNISDDSLVNP